MSDEGDDVEETAAASSADPVDRYAGISLGSSEWKREVRYDRIRKANTRLAKKLAALRDQIRLMRNPNVNLATRAHVPTSVTRGPVRQLASVGVKQFLIAQRMQLPLGNFKKLYGEDYKAASMGSDVKVLTNYLGMATNPDHPASEKAAKKWLEVRVPGWKEVKRIETDDVSKRAPQVIDSSRLNQDERDQLRTLLMKTEAQALPGPSFDGESVVAEYDADEDSEDE
jgi:hypothetical protein